VLINDISITYKKKEMKHHPSSVRSYFYLHKEYLDLEFQIYTEEKMRLQSFTGV
jgi:beta-galactosidase beta subunit